MASFNLTVEDCSPLVTYEPAGAWSDSSQDDPLLPSYSSQSYHSTSTQGATATIDFYGTGITILGARRSNYGSFAVSVDGNMIAQSTARASENATQQTLGTISDLRPGKHRAVIENIGGLPIDIDSFVIVDSVGHTDDQLETKVYDDMDPVMSYLPSQSAWGVNRVPMFQGGSIHFSQRPDAMVSMQFWGEAIAVYGAVSPDHADLKITLNDELATMNGGSNGGVNQLRPRTLLYYRSGLGPGRHSFSLSPDSPTPSAPFIDLDSVTVYSGIINRVVPGNTTASSPSPSRTSVGSSNSGNTTGGISKGVLAGAIVASIVGLLVCLGLCFFAWRWHRRRLQGRSGFGLRRSDSPISPDLPMQHEPKKVEAGMISGPIPAPMENSVFVFPPPQPARQPARFTERIRHSIAPSYYGSPESGSSRMSFTSASSGSPLMRPVGTPRTVPAKAFRNPGTPLIPRVPVPLHSPSIVSQNLLGPQGSPRRPMRQPDYI